MHASHTSIIVDIFVSNFPRRLGIVVQIIWGYPFQYSCLENPMDRGAWQATVHRVTKSWTWLKQPSMHTWSDYTSFRFHFAEYLGFVFYLSSHYFPSSRHPTGITAVHNKESALNAGDTGETGLIPGSGKFPWRRAWQPTPVFCLKNPMDREAWWTTVHSITKNQKWLKWFSTHTYSD